MSTQVMIPTIHKAAANVNMCGFTQIIVKYKNETGRKDVLSISELVHDDFHMLDNIIRVTVPIECLMQLEQNMDIEKISLDGSVHYTYCEE